MKYKIKNAKFEIILAVFGLVVFFRGVPVQAARVYFEVQENTLSRNEAAHVDVVLDPEGALVNAVGGNIVFDGKVFAVKDISSADSVVGFWIDQPREISPGTVLFSGIIPGGFSGVRSPYYEGTRPGKLLKLALQAKESGISTISLQDMKAFLNDGSGTEIPLQNSSIELVLTDQGSQQSSFAVLEDHDPPEEFFPIVARDRNIFDGKWFIAFTANDKGSGVDRYEAREDLPHGDIRRFLPFWAKWRQVESPYVVYDQSRVSNVLIKAVDKQGNERVATVSAVAGLPWYKDYRISGILFLVVLVVIVNAYRRRRRR